MPIPKSVTKVDKNGVTYTSNIEAANYALFQLSRAALRDVAKFVKRRWREEYYTKLKRRSGKSPKSFKAVVIATRKTLYPRVEIGIPHSAPGKPVQGFWAYFHEHGTKNQPKIESLKNVVNSNIATIIEIESQYLSALSDEAEMLRLIEQSNEEDIEIEGDSDE